MSAYESAPGAVPVKIVRYPVRRRGAKISGETVFLDAVRVSYDELIRNAAFEAAFSLEEFLPKLSCPENGD